MGMFICVDSGEEGTHRASISCPVEGWPLYQGVCLRAIIGYLLTLQAKTISYNLLLEEGFLDLNAATPTTDKAARRQQSSIPNYETLVSDALVLLKSWARKKQPCHLRGALDMDVMRRLAEAHNTSVHFDLIPNECPSVLTDLNFGGIYYLLAFPDHGDLGYEEAREMIFVIDKVIRYSANLYRKRVARMKAAADPPPHYDGVSDTCVKNIESSENDDESNNSTNGCTTTDEGDMSPYGIWRAKDVSNEDIVEVEIDTSDGRHPGYCILNDCIEFSYGFKEVLATCEPGETVTVGASDLKRLIPVC